MRHFGGASGVAKYQVSIFYVIPSHQNTDALVGQHHHYHLSVHRCSFLRCHFPQTALKTATLFCKSRRTINIHSFVSHDDSYVWAKGWLIKPAWSENRVVIAKFVSTIRLGILPSGGVHMQVRMRREFLQS